MTNESIVSKIWNLCHILRGDGVSYHQYISELTYLLFLKIAEKNGSESLLPEGYRWKNLISHPTSGLLSFYQEMLTHLGNHASNKNICDIYMFPTTVFSHEENLKAVIDGIGKIDWDEVSFDGFGKIYEGLLQHSADVRSGAGQYFTPRALVSAIVQITKPRTGELIQDPTTGSGGFLVTADRYIRINTPSETYDKNPPRYQGAEIEKNTRRICLMNTFLNGLDAHVIFGDALTNDAKSLEPADVILANPPFGSKSGSRRKLRADIPFPNTNKQLAFLQHIYLNLKEGGRAAVVLPDNALFDDGIATQIRQDLMAKCNLHTILKLPAGIFSSAGVNTNVLFFSKASSPQIEATSEIWIYDLRSGMPSFGKTRSLKIEDFAGFIEAYGDDPSGVSPRKDEGEGGRFRRYTRQEIAALDDNLDITWLRDNNQVDEQLFANPAAIAEEILARLRVALDEIVALNDEISVGQDQIG